jgi:hypothetical protein
MLKYESHKIVRKITYNLFCVSREEFLFYFFELNLGLGFRIRETSFLKLVLLGHHKQVQEVTWDSRFTQRGLFLSYRRAIQLFDKVIFLFVLISSFCLGVFTHGTGPKWTKFQSLLHKTGTERSKVQNKHVAVLCRY